LSTAGKICSRQKDGRSFAIRAPNGGALEKLSSIAPNILIVSEPE
jgi:hypothetical protein